MLRAGRRPVKARRPSGRRGRVHRVDRRRDDAAPQLARASPRQSPGEVHREALAARLNAISFGHEVARSSPVKCPRSCYIRDQHMAGSNDVQVERKVVSHGTRLRRGLNTSRYVTLSRCNSATVWRSVAEQCLAARGPQLLECRSTPLSANRFGRPLEELRSSSSTSSPTSLVSLARAPYPPTDRHLLLVLARAAAGSAVPAHGWARRTSRLSGRVVSHGTRLRRDRTPSVCHTVTVQQCNGATMPQCGSVAVWHSDSVTEPRHNDATLSRCHVATGND